MREKTEVRLNPGFLFSPPLTFIFINLLALCCFKAKKAEHRHAEEVAAVSVISFCQSLTLST